MANAHVADAHSVHRELYGLMAEFDTVDALIHAAEKVKHEGYTETDAFSPYPIEGLSEAIGDKKMWLPLIVLGGGITGACFGFLLQWYCASYDFPIEVAARPLTSTAAFIPITFECTILFSSITAVVAMFFLNGLPLPYHPVFNVPRFAFATKDRFYIVIESVDMKFDKEGTKRFLESCHPKGIYEVPV